MGNKLKRMLDQKETGLVFTVSFNSLEDREKFLNAVNETCETGTSQNVPVPKSLEFKKTIGDFQYPYENVENIVKMMVFPAEDKVGLPIILDGAESEYIFLRNRNKDVVQLKSINSKIVDVNLFIMGKDNKISLTYTSHPGNADTIDELILEYKRFLALIDFLFQKQETIEKLQDIKKYFIQSIRVYERDRQLCEVLSISVTPKMVIAEDDNDGLIEKLYLLLVKQAIIRQDDKLNHISMASVDDIEVGKEIFAVYYQQAEIEIYGVHRMVYTVNCIFGAEIREIGKNIDGDNIVYFKESEKNPMYRAYTAFLDKEAAEEEMSAIGKKRDQYKNAVNWVDQLRELVNS